MYLEAVTDVYRNIRLGSFELRYFHVFAGFVYCSLQFANGIVTLAPIGKIGIGIACNVFALAFNLQHIIAAIAAPAGETGALVYKLALPLPGEILGRNVRGEK